MPRSIWPSTGSQVHKHSFDSRRWLWICVAAFMVSGCGGGDPLTVTEVQVRDAAVVDLQTGASTTTLVPGGQYALEEAALGRPLRMRALGQGQGSITVGSSPLAIGIERAVSLTSIEPGAELEIPFVTDGQPTAKATLRLTPADFPAFTVRGQTSIDGRILLTPISFNGAHRSYLLMLGSDGRILYFRRSPNNEQYFDFKTVDIDGARRYVYLIGPPSDVGPGFVAARAEIMNERLEVIDRITGLTLPSGQTIPLENHDILVLGKDHYLLSAVVQALVNVPGHAAPVSVLGSVIQEVRDGRTLFTWQSTDHPELYEEAEEGNAYGVAAFADYMHFNSFEIDPKDGHILASFRSQNAVYKISRTTGDIIWKLGGKSDDFGLDPSIHPQGQHTARLSSDGSLLIFDNNTFCSRIGATIDRFASRDSTTGLNYCDRREDGMRILKFKIAESGTSVVSAHKFPVSNDAATAQFTQRSHQRAGYMGSVQELSNGRWLLGLGSRGMGEMDVAEFDPSTATIGFELRFNRGGQPANQITTYSYRAHFAPPR